MSQGRVQRIRILLQYEYYVRFIRHYERLDIQVESFFFKHYLFWKRNMLLAGEF